MEAVSNLTASLFLRNFMIPVDITEAVIFVDL